MSPATRCLTLDPRQVRRVFPGSAPERVLVAALAGLPPDPAWEGAEVSLAHAEQTLHLALSGPGAGELSPRLQQRLEQLGLEATPCAEPGARDATPLVRVLGGRWSAPGAPS